jgi:hypothetical protein
MSQFSRREFLTKIGAAAGVLLLGWRRRPVQAQAAHNVYMARNGTPVSNVQRVIAQAGGIQQFVDYNDVVVLKPNGQWPNQGYTHTECMKGLIDVILNHPGGFGGEVIVTEHIHRNPTDAMASNYCWNISPSNRNNNWPDMSYLELEADYHARGIANVTAIPLYDIGQGDFIEVDDPGDLGTGQHGWVRLPAYTTTANSQTFTPSYPILRSNFSDKLIDLQNGVWEAGSYNGQQVKLIFLPTLNNHGWGSEDYAGITSAVKCHIGFQEGTSLHYVGYDSGDPDAVGEAVGHLITQVFSPTFYLTCAEYSGHYSRTGAATHTKTVGLCADPVTLDYWMSKYVLYPCNNAAYFNPDNNNHTRETLLGCHSKGVGTLDETEMVVRQSDLSLDNQIYLPLVLQ